MAEKIISKGFYTHSVIPNFVCPKQYVVVRKGKENQLFFRFENPKNETLTAISFSVDCYDAEGRAVKTAKIEQNNLKVKGHSCFVVNRPVVLDAGIVDFKVTVNSVGYGDYCYVTHGNDVEVIYEKQDGAEEIDRVPFLHKLGGHTHKSMFKTIHTPKFFVSLVALVLVSLFVILGVKIYNFTRTEELFSLDMVEYTFATDDRKNGPIIIVGINSKAGNIIVPDEIEGHDVIAVASKAFANSKIRSIEFKGSIEIRDNAFTGSSNLKTVHIESTNKIGIKAFYNCKKLTDVVIDKGLQTIGQRAFDNCTSLTNIHFPDTVISIGEYAFNNCSRLTALTIPNSTAEIGEKILYNCNSLSALQTPYIGSVKHNQKTLQYFFGAATPASLKTLVVTNTDYINDSMFNGEKNLETVVFTTPVTSIGAYAFNGCSNLRTFDIPDTVELIGDSAFSGCSSLETARIPESITSISESLFRGCSSLRSVSLHDKLTQVGDNAFRDCSSLEALVLPETVSFIGSNALSNCTGLKTLVLPYLGTTANSTSRTLSSIISSGGYCKLESFTLLSGTTLPDYAFAEFKKLTEVTLPSQIQSISANCFRNCESLESIDIPESVTSIGDYAFYGCSSLSELEISEFVTSTGAYAFANCSDLEAITFHNNSTTLGEGVFYYCSSLSYLNLPADITTLPNKMCEGCSSLEALIIPAGVTAMPSYVFYNCSSLKSVVLPLNLTDISSYSFANCSSLPAFPFPSTVQSLGYSAFAGCTSLTSVVIPETIDNVGQNVFSNCTGLESFTAPFPTAYTDGVVFNYYFSTVPTSLKSVTLSSVLGLSLPANAFMNCSSIEEIILPDNITNIGSNAFKNCAALTSLEIPDSVSSIGYGILIGTSALDSITLPYAGPSASDMTQGFRYFYYDLSGAYSSYYLPEKLSTVTLTKASVIPTDSFSGMYSLKRVNMPDNITTIRARAFQGCYSLNELVLPASLTSIDSTAFSNCIRLYEVTNLSGLSLNISALRVFNSESEWNGNKIVSDGFTLLLASDGYWYLTDYTLTGDTLELPSGLQSGSQNVKYALPTDLFYQDQGIKKVNISADVTKISSYTFRDCRNLTEITADQTNSFEEICSYAFYGSTATNIQIPSSTQRIGFCAFQYSGITSITIPSSLTEIDENAFHYCSSLKTVYFENGSSLLQIGSGAFEYSGITSITLPSSLTEIGSYAFCYCSSLKNVSFQSGSALTSIGTSAFLGSGITNIAIPASVTSIGNYAFQDCSLLKSVTFKGGSLLNTIGESAFASSGITAIVLPASLTSMGSYAFQNCSSLASVTFENGSSISNISSYAFASTKIEDITIPSSATTIGSYAFQNCSSLKRVSFAANSNLTTIETYAFTGTKVSSVIFPASLTAINDYAFYYCSNLKDISFADTSNLTSIGVRAFESTGISSVSFPRTLTSIGNSAFYYCSQLTDIEFAANSQLNSIGTYAFANTGIKRAVLPAALTSIGDYAFYSCYYLGSVTINSAASVGSYAFSNSNNIFEVYNLAGLQLAVGDYSFGRVAVNAIIIHTSADAESLHDVTANGFNFKKSDDNWFLMGLSDSNTSNSLVLDSFTYNGQTVNSFVVYKSAFRYNSNITSVTVGSAVSKIMSNAFNSCYNIKTLTFDADCTITEIAESAFAYCYQIQRLILPDSLQKIGIYAFESCSGLEVLLLPESLTYIGDCSFLHCNKLYDVMNLSTFNVSKGSYNNGYAGYYALSVRQSSTPLSVTEIANNSGTAKFVKHDNTWFLVGFDAASSANTVQIPEITVGATTYNYKIFGTAFYTLSAGSVILPKTVASIDSNTLDNLYYKDIYYLGTSSEWQDIDPYGSLSYVYFYADCVHESGMWTYNSNGLPTTSIPAITSTVVSAATCKDPGTRKYVCTGCGEETLEEIPATSNHTPDSNGECTVCGKIKTVVRTQVTSSNFNSVSCITNHNTYPFTINASNIIASTNKANGSTSALVITATETMTVSFSYKVSSENNFDFLKIYVDGDQKVKVSGTNSSYTSFEITLSAGQTLRIEYSKDGSQSSGDDCAYIKDLKVDVTTYVDP